MPDVLRFWRNPTTGQLYRGPNGGILRATQYELECRCCDLSFGGCSPSLAKTYTVTIPADCNVDTCDSTDHDFGGAHTVYAACDYYGLASPEWHSPRWCRGGPVTGDWTVQLYWVSGRWYVTVFKIGQGNCRPVWEGPTTQCDPTGNYAAAADLSGCAPCTITDCNDTVVVS